MNSVKREQWIEIVMSGFSKTCTVFNAFFNLLVGEQFKALILQPILKFVLFFALLCCQVHLNRSQKVFCQVFDGGMKLTTVIG